MIWLAVECQWAYLAPYYNSSICYYYHFEHLFLLNQITFNVYILILACWLLILHYKRVIYVFIVWPGLPLYVGAERIGGSIC